ncbi:MAG: hypothetical protein GY801_31505 [bacterium]|nr:hypothetical protein [bacterium]
MREKTRDDLVARGPNFVFTQKFILETYDTTTWDTLLQRLPPQAAEVWKGPLLVTGVYSFSAFKTMIALLSTLDGLHTDQETAQLYEYIASHSLSTVYKVFFRLTTPAFVIRNYPKLWKRFFTTGTVDVVEARKGYAEVTFTLPDNFLDWLPPACYGYSKKAIEMAGGMHLAMKEGAKTRAAHGGWEIRYVLSWEE